MKKGLFVGIAMLLAVAGAAPCFAQNSTLRAAAGDKYLISAKAGGVNYVEGDVRVEKAVGKSGLLLKGDALAVGDRVVTGTDGRAEILLNPGSYIRLAENSEFEFVTTDLEDLKLNVNRGSAILEVYAANDFRVSLNSPKDGFGLIETGVYRIDVDADGNGRLEVWKGKAVTENSVLKGGRVASSESGNLVVEKFDRDDRDAFETWSKGRSKELAKETGKLKDKALRTTLMQSFLGGRWNMYDSFGLWVFSPAYGRYCFLPFGYGWESPYGYGFGSDIWWYRLPQAVYYYYPSQRPQRPSQRPTQGTTSSGTPRTGGPGDGQRRRPVERRQPVFAAMQGGSQTGPRVSRGIDRTGEGSDGGFVRVRPGQGQRNIPLPDISRPTRSQPVFSRPAGAQPAPIRVKGNQ